MFDNPNFFTSQRNQQNPPFATAVTNTQTSSSAPVPFAAPWSVGTFTTSPFPQPQIPSPSQALFFAQSQFIVMPAQFKAAYTIQWTASVQHQFPHDWQAQIDYIGNTTRHDPMSFTFDPAVYIPGVWGANGTGCTGIVTTGPAKVNRRRRRNTVLDDQKPDFALPAHLAKSQHRAINTWAAAPARTSWATKALPITTAWLRPSNTACRAPSACWPTGPGRSA